MKKSQDRCDKCGSTESKTFWDFEDGSMLCDNCHSKFGDIWLNDIDKDSNFEVIYSIFMLIFGFGIISCFIFLVGLALYTFHIFFLFFFWPILVGILIAIFRREGGYEKVLKEQDSKKLHRIIESICVKTNQRKPHKIFLTEGSDLAVTGFFRKKIIIGMVALKFMSEEELTAVLAHEYGHFAKKDTVFGYLIYRIQVFFAIQEQVNRQNLSFNYSLIVYLPTWIFFLILSKYFELIALWYSRRVEFRSDSFAANLVGKQIYANALVKYCVISDIFEKIVPNSIFHYLQKNKKITNVYEYIGRLYDEENITKGIKFVLSDKSSWWSTHPSISERLEVLGTEKIDIEINDKMPHILENQKKYEEDASDSLTEKMAYSINDSDGEDEDDD